MPRPRASTSTWSAQLKRDTLDGWEMHVFWNGRHPHYLVPRLRRRPKLGFSDCMVLESARKAGHVPLATFDKELSKLDDVERL